MALRIRFFYLVAFVFSFVLVLNPYTKLLPLAYFLIPLLAVSVYTRFKLIGGELIFVSFILIMISIVGVTSSFLHGIGQFVHLKVAFSIILYFLLAHSFYVVSTYYGITFNEFVYVILLSVLFNSSVILFQVYIPGLRDFTESFLVLSGNVDWTEGFRYRGLASGGGASLSVLIPVSMVLALYLYTEKNIGVVQLITMFSVLLLSLFFIGRTGFILLPIVFLSFVFFNFKKYLLRVVSILIIVPLLIILFGDEIKNIVVSKYGLEFFNYSFGFILDGAKGLKEEGTFDVIIGFLKVMPTTFPEVLIGYGFYGGSDFYPWTDSGYSRMFLSVGYVFGSIFYLAFFFVFRHVIFKKKYLFVTIGLILLVAEAKEPLLFTGYSSRVYIMLLVFYLLMDKEIKNYSRLRDYCSLRTRHVDRA